MVAKKVVLLGNSAVGKTSLFNRIVSDTFIADGVSSICASMRSKYITTSGGQVLKINLWDTAGQEKF